MQKIYSRKLVLRFVWRDLAAARALLALITTNAAVPSGTRLRVGIYMGVSDGFIIKINNQIKSIYFLIN